MIPQPHHTQDAGYLEPNRRLGKDAAYLEHNLKLVTSGVKSRAPGIRRCPDCRTPYIDDHSGLPHCPDCRINHRRYCRDCRTLIPNTTDGDRLCASCADQETLF